MTNEPPPEDLAGYQLIVTGVVQEGDIFVYAPDRYKAWAASSTFGCQIKGNPDIGVYRKMACPKAGDHDKVWRNLPMSDGQNFYIPKIEDDNKAKTDDAGKPPMATLPWKAVRQVAKVQAYGHKKYGDFYNYKKGMEITRQLNCAIRHIADYLDGNDLDKESGLNHLAHAATRLLFTLETLEEGSAIDDRYKK